MRPPFRQFALLSAGFAVLLALHGPFLKLPYFWDEAGYYIPAARDFYRHWLLIPESTLPTGHTPLVMVYLALAWHLFGFSPLVTRAAMLLVAAGTVTALYMLARRVASREAAVWSAALLAVSPLFFAQSSLAHLDLAAALFTTLAVLALLDGRLLTFAVAASLAVLAKETAAALLPVAWIWGWRARKAGQVPPLRTQMLLVVPILPLAAWAVYYHHKTGFWTGNAEYLQYNLFSTLGPARIFWSLLRRLYEVFIGGFHWLLVIGAVLGAGKSKFSHPDTEVTRYARDFSWLAGGLGVVYVLLHSIVGGAILPRYLLPIFPLFYLGAVMFIWRLRPVLARTWCAAVMAGFIGAWFINPPYPFPFEDNLAYTDFVRLHQQSAQYLETFPRDTRILTAWPATDELSRPFLGYVDQPRRIVPLEGFTARDFGAVATGDFDILYLYSRKWEPPGNWLARFPFLGRIQQRHFDYAPQISGEELRGRYGLSLMKRFERRGQWVEIYRNPLSRSVGHVVR